MAKKLLTDFERKPDFLPGDRILVKTASNLRPEQKAALRRTVDKFAGVEVRTLIVNCMETEMTIRRGLRESVICSPDHVATNPTAPNTANVNCVAVDFQPGDILEVKPMVKTSPGWKSAVERHMKNWVGSEVELIVLGD